MIIGLNVYATGVMFKKWSPVPVHSRLLPSGGRGEEIEMRT